MMKLYGFGATRWIRALWALRVLDLEFECETVNLPAGEHRRRDFLEINPAGEVPVLVDGDVMLTESAAFVIYLAEKYPDKDLIPADLKARAQANRWLFFAVTELEQPLWRITRHTRLYPEDRRLPADVVLAREEFVAMAAILDRHMAGRRFVVGDGLTVADLVMAYTLDWAGELGLLEDFTHLRAYVDGMYARPEAPFRIAEAFARIEG